MINDNKSGPIILVQNQYNIFMDLMFKVRLSFGFFKFNNPYKHIGCKSLGKRRKQKQNTEHSSKDIENE